MPLDKHPRGETHLTFRIPDLFLTPDEVTLRLMELQRSALLLEISGLTHSSERSVYAHIKRTYGVTGGRETVLEKFTEMCLAQRRNVRMKHLDHLLSPSTRNASPKEE